MSHHCPDWESKLHLWHAPYQVTLGHVAEMGGADLIAFSPPYCDARTYGMDVSWTDADYAELGDHVFRALKPGGHALVNVDAPVREWRPGFGTERGFHPWRLMLDWAERVGFRVPEVLIFARMGQVGFWPRGFRHDHEPLLWFQRPGSDGWMDVRALVERAAKGRTAGLRRSYRMADGAIVAQVTSGPCSEDGTRQRGSLWDYGPVGLGCTGAPDIESQNHPARWPYRLARDLVLCFCPPAGLVVDPFVGAGTTAAAALDHGRRFAGGDLGGRQDNEDNQRRGLAPKPWVEVTRDVLRERYRQQGLFG